MNIIISLLTLLRPKQWLKNFFVFVPLIFSGLLFDEISLVNTIYASVLFCLSASSVYVFNDIIDLEHDKNHPVKSQQRPLASGAINIKSAVLILVILYLVIFSNYFIFAEVTKVLLIYIILNIFYTVLLKNHPIIDIFVISLGFVLRVIAGAVAIAIQTSSWLLIIILCLALYMSSIKRRQEILLFDKYKPNQSKNKHKQRRNVLDFYNRSMLNRYAEIAGTSCFIFYTLYVLLFNPVLTASIIFVIFGLFRYWYVVEHHYGGESPTDMLLIDKQLMFTVLVWLVSCIIGIYYI